MLEGDELGYIYRWFVKGIIEGGVCCMHTYMLGLFCS